MLGRGRIAAMAAVCGMMALSGAAGQPAADRQDGMKATVSMPERLARYATVRLAADLSGLSERERRMIPLLIEAAGHMDEAFWIQAYGDKNKLLSQARDGALRRYLEINYGPWDRLLDNEPFVEGVGPKPVGANFYPRGMTREEFERTVEASPVDGDRFKSTYTMIRRRDDGALTYVPYHEFFREQVMAAAQKLEQAMILAEDPSLKRYLQSRAQALRTDDYFPSDLAWMRMKSNTVDVVIGPIETYEDRLFGYKAAYEAFVLVKDKEWSARLARYAELLPNLQRGLPVEEVYKREMPGSDSDLNAYDVVYYAGDCNAGAKTIAINLPNDERVQAEAGSRRLQLKNAMRAKFDKILVPLSNVLIAEEQRRHVTFGAFFANTMFHEVAHGLGIANTINGQGTVRQALRDQHAALEEAKADILGLYLVVELFKQGELTEGDVRDNYVTFLAGIFRSVRFGAASAHGRANLLGFNFFRKMGAFTRDSASGAYRADFDKMREAIAALSGRILKLQGDGDYAGVLSLMSEMGEVGEALRTDLDKLRQARIPVDIVFEQGASVLSLPKPGVEP